MPPAAGPGPGACEDQGMEEPGIRRRRDDDMTACVEALATVHEMDRYPARW